jgi:hypothetical protein
MTNSTSNISLKLIPANVPSLCIPRVFSNIPRDRIFRIVDDLGLGRILSIDMVPKVSEKGEKYNRIFIHFTAWSTSKDAEKARQIALSGGEFKILYDDPYFWKVSASTSTTPFAPVAATPKPANLSRPKLAFDDSSAFATDQSQKDHQQKHQYPNPESRREKYGPRPDGPRPDGPRPVSKSTDRRQEQKPRRQYEQNTRRHDDHRLKEDNTLANVKAADHLLDKLALDIQEKQKEEQQEKQKEEPKEEQQEKQKEEPKEEPEQDMKLTISQLNSLYTNDTALLPPVRRRANKGPKKRLVTKAVSVAVMIDVEDGEEVEVKVEENA